MEENILYCGMADDILTPMILVPNFTAIFVIDLFDSAFAKNRTWEGQKRDILQCLKDGNNEKSHHRDVYLHYDKSTPTYSIDEQCNIKEEIDNGKIWKVKFYYKGIKRELIYFHHTNFIANWDEEIKNISHLMCMGAEFPIEKKILNKMIRERCNEDCKFYDQFAEFNNTIKTTAIGRTIFINDLENVLCEVEKN